MIEPNTAIESLDRIPHFVWTTGDDGRVTYANEQFAAYVGAAAGALLGTRWIEYVHPDDRDSAQAAWSRAVAASLSYSTEYRVRRHDGAYRWFLARGARSETVREDTRWIGTCTDIDDRFRAWREAQTANEFAREFIAKRQRVESGLTLLSRTSAAMLNSLSVDAQLRDMAKALVVDFASLVVIDIVGTHGERQRITHHREPEGDRVLSEDGNIEPSGNHPIALAMRSRRSTIATVNEEWVQSLADAGDRMKIVQALGLRSLIVVPIITPNLEVVGALTCGLDASSQREDYSSEDMPFIEEIGRRAGTAFANARLYEREHRIAVALQQASLPILLPNLDFLRLSAYYRPGNAEATIGGDWYDAFLLRDGRAVFTVGDVLGNGLNAAVMMTKLRQAIQSAAMIDDRPSAMLEVADQTLMMHGSDKYATAIVAIYDRITHKVEICSAGHPGPTFRFPDGRVEDLFVPGLMLGVMADAKRETITHFLPEGTMMVMYTDGLIEAGRDLEDGMRKVRLALNDETVLRADRPARALVKSVLANQPAPDDTAVLIAYIPE